MYLAELLLRYIVKFILSEVEGSLTSGRVVASAGQRVADVVSPDQRLEGGPASVAGDNLTTAQLL